MDKFAAKAKSIAIERLNSTNKALSNLTSRKRGPDDSNSYPTEYKQKKENKPS